jgi:hypothetical protein
MLGNQRGGAALRILLVLVLLGGIGFAALAAFRVGPAPHLTIQPAMKGIGRRTPVTVEVEAGGRGLRGIEVAVVQGTLRQVLATKSYAPGPAWKFWGGAALHDRLQVEVGRETVKGLKPGTATIEVAAERPGTWLRAPGRATVTLDLPVRLNPPTLAPQSGRGLRRPGRERVRGVPGGGELDEGRGAGGGGLLPRPSAPRRGSRGEVRALRRALRSRRHLPGAPGGRGRGGEPGHGGVRPPVLPKKWHRSEIPLTDPFLQKVVPEIVSQSPEVEEKGSLLDTYLAINRDLRKVNNAEIRGLAGKSQPKFLWSKPFLRMAAAPEAGFADHRTYTYQGKSVDFQVHLGVDMADTQNVPVPSANDGVVVLAKYLGIYGNTVIVDHGYGLMTLYGHLSSIGVKEGQEVKRSQELGRSGATGSPAAITCTTACWWTAPSSFPRSGGTPTGSRTASPGSCRAPSSSRADRLLEERLRGATAGGQRSLQHAAFTVSATDEQAGTHTRGARARLEPSRRLIGQHLAQDIRAQVGPARHLVPEPAGELRPHGGHQLRFVRGRGGRPEHARRHERHTRRARTRVRSGWGRTGG